MSTVITCLAIIATPCIIIIVSVIINLRRQERDMNDEYPNDESF